MHRKHRVNHPLVVLWIGIWAALGAGIPWTATRADLIRPRTTRSFPDIAGDIAGSQTYSFDPSSQTGTFQVVNAPHLLTLGPDRQDMVRVEPNADGTLLQSVQIKLNKQGKLVESPENRFELHGTVVIGDQTFDGLLLRGRPTSFGARAQGQTSHSKMDAFDLNLKVTGGKLAEAFGNEAYLRIIPQSNSTFEGIFTADFSGDKPLTNLRGSRSRLAAPVPEPTALLVIVVGGIAIAGSRFLRRRSRP
jgi:hypothetical protein